MSGRYRPGAAICLLTLIGVLQAAAAGAQRPGAPAPVYPVAVGSGHWVYPLLDRMAAAGLLDGVWLPGRRPVGARLIGAALDSAVARAGGGGWVETSRSARAWFRAEYGVRGGRRLRVAPVAGLEVADGPGTGPDAGRLGARALYRPGDAVGIRAEPAIALRSRVEVVPRAGVLWQLGPVQLGASYGALRLGPAASGGIVVGGLAERTRLEAVTARPVVLPGILRHAGPVVASASVSRIGADSLGPAVAFFTGTVRVQPHPRVTFGVYRSSLLAWEVDGRHPGPFDLAGALVGAHSVFDDQKASLSGSVRVDVLGTTVSPYAVWGFEDSAGIDEDPGLVVGTWLPSLPLGVPVGVRYEYTAFGRAAQTLIPWSRWKSRNWYRHRAGRRAYVDGDGELLGHPLGGYGREHRLELEGASTDGVLLAVGGFDRHREDGVGIGRNLLADVMPGRSHGGFLDLVVLARGLRLEAGLEMERGSGWSRTHGRVLGRVVF